MAADNRTITDPDRLSDPTDAEVEPGGDDAEETGRQSEDRASELPLDQVFETLKNKRRRTVLHYLNDHEGPISLSDLAEHVAADENDTTVRQVTSRERKCAYVGLYQCHLPKMDNMDIIEFNQNRGRIELGPNAPQLKEYLDYSETTARPWPLFYSGVAAVGTALVFAAQWLAGPGLAPLALSLVALVGVAGLAATHAASESPTENARGWLRGRLG